MKIRQAISSDIPKLADLMQQLGYLTSIEQMQVRFTVFDLFLVTILLVITKRLSE